MSEQNAPPPPNNKKSLNINSGNFSGYSRFRENLHLKMGGCERLGFEKIPTSRSLPLEVLFCPEIIKIQKVQI